MKGKKYKLDNVIKFAKTDHQAEKLEKQGFHEVKVESQEKTKAKKQIKEEISKGKGE